MSVILPPHLVHSTNYLLYASRLRQLHRLIARGMGDGEWADRLRDHMDAEWRNLTPAEIADLSDLSESLYAAEVTP